MACAISSIRVFAVWAEVAIASHSHSARRLAFLGRPSDLTRTRENRPDTGSDATVGSLARHTSEVTQRLSVTCVPASSAWVDRDPRGLRALRLVHDRRPPADLCAGWPAGRRATKPWPALQSRAPSAAALAIARAHRVPLHAASRLDPD